MRYSKTTISLLAFLCGVFVAIPAAQAATITVTSESGGTGGPDCTLRDAITAANTDTATGGCVAGNGGDTIELPVGATILLTEVDNGTDFGNGLPRVSTEISINGNGSTVERDRADKTPQFRIFWVAGDGRLTLQNLTVSNGSIDLETDSGGGGIVNVGILTLTDSTVSNNEAGFGGGIANFTTATVTNTTFSGNFGSLAGGGIFNTGVLTLTDSTFSGNFGGALGGGGILNIGTSMLTNTTINGNVDDGFGGGGIFNPGILTLTDSTVCGNLPGQILGAYTDGGGNLVADKCPPCPADLDGDGAVGASDLAILLGTWGPVPTPDPPDFDGDGDVDAFDLAILLGAWGPCR